MSRPATPRARRSARRHAGLAGRGFTGNVRAGIALAFAGLVLSACASTAPAGRDGPAADGPATDGPATDAPVADVSATDAPAADAPAADAPVADVSAMDVAAEDVIQEDSYQLGQGDRIAIQVFDEPDLTMEAGVNSSGTISYSYLGDIRVANKTTDQIAKEIAGLLSNGYLRNPSVNVSIVEFRPFFINGEVRTPGSYPYQPGLTLDRAIALAGGLTDRASTRKMFVMKAGNKQDEVSASMSTKLAPGDIVSIKEGFF